MDILTANSANKVVSAKVTENLKKLQFAVTVTGDFSAADRVATMHTKLGGIIVTITKRKEGETTDIVQQRPLNELIEQMAQHNDDVILITTNGTTNVLYEALLDINGTGSIINTSQSFTEVKVDLGAATDITCVVSGERSASANSGNLKYDTIATLSNQASELNVLPEMAHIAVPDTTTRLLVKNLNGQDQEYSQTELKRSCYNSNGLTYLDNGLAKMATKWFVFPIVPGVTGSFKVTTSNSATIYILKQY